MRTLPVQIQRVQDFYDLVYPAYNQLTRDGSEAASLEIILAPGEYGGLGLSLGSCLNPHAIAIKLRGEDPGNPPILTHLNLQLVGETVQLEDLVFQQTVSNVAVLDIGVNAALSIRRCAFLGNGSQSPPGGQLLQLKSYGAAATVDISDSWFIQNWTTYQNPMLAFETLPPHRFQQVRLENVAFLDNRTEILIAPYATRSLEMFNTVYLPGIPPQGSPFFVAINQLDTVLTVDHSLLLGHSLPQLISRWSSTEDSVMAFEPLRLQHSTLVLEQPEEAELENGVMTAMTIHPSGVTTFQNREQDWLEQWIEHARRGQAPDFAQMQMALLRSPTLG